MVIRRTDEFVSRKMGVNTSDTVVHRRIKTEEKAKVVTAVWGTEFILLLATLAVLH